MINTTSHLAVDDPSADYHSSIMYAGKFQYDRTPPVLNTSRTFYKAKRSLYNFLEASNTTIIVVIRKLYRTKSMTLSIGLLLIAILAFSSLADPIINGQQSALTQSSIKITKDRNLVIDLGNGVKTNAQLTVPALGNGPYPGVLLIPGS